MRRGSRTAILLACGLLLGAAAAAGAIPSGEPPGAGSGPIVGSGPPPAWIETSTGDRWLGPGGGCWAGPGEPPTCALVPPTVRGMPRILVRAGETATFHLGFAPTGVVGLRGNIRLRTNRTVFGRAYRLGATAAVAWKVRGRSGRASLTAPGEGGVANFLFDVVVREGA